MDTLFTMIRKKKSMLVSLSPEMKCPTDISIDFFFRNCLVITYRYTDMKITCNFIPTTLFFDSNDSSGIY